MSNENKSCAECGMPCAPGEYHPYAACLMFKQTRNSESVHANLKAVAEHARATQQATKGDERAAHSYADDPERQWTEFWAPICAPNGVLDLEQVKRELSDYSMLLDYVPRVYDHATGGAVSKPNTKPTAVCSEIDNHIQDLVEDAINDDRESRAAVPQAEQRMSDAEDAARYRWLRKQQWNEADMFVVVGSKSQVRLGTDCPSLDRLDAAIDAARKGASDAD